MSRGYPFSQYQELKKIFAMSYAVAVVWVGTVQMSEPA